MDLQALLAQAQQMQQQFATAQQELAESRVTGTSGGGLVTATISGTGELVGLDIAAAAYDAHDPDALATIADLVIAAVRDARAAADSLTADRMGPLAAGLPGFGGGRPGAGPPDEAIGDLMERLGLPPASGGGQQGGG